jgi:hypothetical protein
MVCNVEPGTTHVEVRSRTRLEAQHGVEIHSLRKAICDDREVVHPADHVSPSILAAPCAALRFKPIIE